MRNIAYHCGANFDEFSLDFFNTGEGFGGAFGKAIYLATDPDVARAYCKYARDDDSHLYKVIVTGGLYDPVHGEPHGLRDELLVLADREFAARDYKRGHKHTPMELIQAMGHDAAVKAMGEIGMVGVWVALPVGGREIAVYDPSAIRVVRKSSIPLEDRVAALHVARKDLDAMQVTLEVYNALRDAVEQGDLIDWHPAEGRAIIHAAELGLDHLDHAIGMLWFDFGGGSGIQYDSNRTRVIIPTALPLSDGLVQPLVKNAVKRNRESIIHELTHHFDYLRMGKGWGEAIKDYKQPSEDAEAYYNSPVEMNAYFQMGAVTAAAGYRSILDDLEPGTGPDNTGSMAQLAEFEREVRYGLRGAAEWDGGGVSHTEIDRYQHPSQVA